MPYEQTSGSFDFGFLPPNYRGDVQVFSGASLNNLNQWTKPRGVSMVHITCIGGGGGGGGGFSAASTNPRGGGGGGGCSGVGIMTIFAHCLPDSIKVFVGAGGVGGSGSGQNGGNGTATYVSLGTGLASGSAANNLVMLANGSSQANGGGAGTGGAAGTAGAAPTIGTKGLVGWPAAWGTTNWTVGIAGAGGGAQTGAVGTSLTSQWGLIPLTPGAGGGGVNTVATGFLGGAITLTSALDHAEGSLPAAVLAGGAAGSAAAAGDGQSGVQLFKPFLMTGGTGGGSSDGSTGGRGGNGGIGCGGGGGGGGVTGGAGGNGGSGIVIICSW